MIEIPLDKTFIKGDEKEDPKNSMRLGTHAQSIPFGISGKAANPTLWVCCVSLEQFPSVTCRKKAEQLA